MNKVKLGTVLKEEKAKIGKPDGAGLDLIGVSNELGLQVSRAQRIADLSRYKIIRIGWFAYNPMRANVGSIGIAQGPHHEGIVSPDYVIFSCSEKILPDYLLFFLKSDIGLEAINKNASGAVRKRLYFSDLARIELHVPSIEKQIEILDSVKKIESMVTQLKDPERIGKVSQLKQSILQEAIQGKLTAEWRAQRKAYGIETEPASELFKRIHAKKARLINPSTPLRAGEKKIKKDPSTSLRAGKSLPTITEEEKPFELLEGWEWCRLGDLIYVSSGNGLTSKQMVAGDIPVFGGNGVTGFHNNFNVSEETITIGRVGAYCGSVHLTPRFAWITDNCFKVDFDRESIHKDFLTWYLKFLNLQKASYKGSQPVISGKRIYPILTFLPPLEEQKAIVEKVESLMEKCSTLEEEISQSEQHAQMLMQAVLKESFEN